MCTILTLHGAHGLSLKSIFNIVWVLNDIWKCTDSAALCDWLFWCKAWEKQQKEAYREQDGTVWSGSIGNRDQSWKIYLWMAQKFLLVYWCKSIEVNLEKGEECK